MKLLRILFPIFAKDEPLPPIKTHRIIEFPSHEDMEQTKMVVMKPIQKMNSKREKSIEIEKACSLRSDFRHAVEGFDRIKQKGIDRQYRTPLKGVIDTRVEQLVKDSKKKDFMNVINKC